MVGRTGTSMSGTRPPTPASAPWRSRGSGWCSAPGGMRAASSSEARPDRHRIERPRLGRSAVKSVCPRDRPAREVIDARCASNGAPPSPVSGSRCRRPAATVHPTPRAATQARSATLDMPGENAASNHRYICRHACGIDTRSRQAETVSEARAGVAIGPTELLDSDNRPGSQAGLSAPSSAPDGDRTSHPSRRGGMAAGPTCLE